MISLVIVSHSAKLAEGVVELARGMVGDAVSIAAAGGMADSEGTLGTDALRIQQAIESVYSRAGVLVLVDLGSGILSAEMAVELLTHDQQQHVLVCDAPLVEGAIAAAIQSQLGATLVQAAAEARQALGAKAMLLKPLTFKAEPVKGQSTQGARQTLQLRVHNRLGLHVRPAARLVQATGHFQASVTVADLTNQRGPVNARSINGVATLGAQMGDDIEVVADGPDAPAVLDAIRQLAADNFGDSTESVPPMPSAGIEMLFTPDSPLSPVAITDNETLNGQSASNGSAIGPAYQVHAPLFEIPAHPVEDTEAEWMRFEHALAQTRNEIARTLQSVTKHADRQTAEIFQAHLLFLEDSALLEPTHHAITANHVNAAAAWQHAIDAMGAKYRAMDDDYMHARSVDLADVGDQVLVHLLGKSSEMIQLREPGILIATDLKPAATSQLDPAMVLGIITAAGGVTSHGAILAHALGIPAIVGMGSRLLNVPDGTVVIVDGDNAQAILTPDDKTQARYTQQIAVQRIQQAQAEMQSHEPAITFDGHRVMVAANISSAAAAQKAVESGAEGAGLLRTEFIFLDRQAPPSEEEQYIQYRRAAETFGKRPLVIRTLDVGSDKPLSYINQDHEQNPFLGLRSVRLCLDQPDLFKTQLRAIVRVAAEFPIEVMFPMVAILSEFRAAKLILAQAIEEVRSNGHPVPAQIKTGIVVEVPAAALGAEVFAPEVDFFSIGTNDLAQYTLAAERGNKHVTYLQDALHPAVLGLIDTVVKAAHSYSRWVSVYGELAGDPVAVPALIGLGVDELSMSAAAIPRAKQIVRLSNYADQRSAVRKLLALENASAVRAALQKNQMPAKPGKSIKRAK